MHFPQARAYLQKVTSNVYASYLFILANVQNKIESKIYNPGFQKRAFELLPCYGQWIWSAEYAFIVEYEFSSSSKAQLISFLCCIPSQIQKHSV